jgi:hypothetical protein
MWNYLEVSKARTRANDARLRAQNLDPVRSTFADDIPF